MLLFPNRQPALPLHCCLWCRLLHNSSGVSGGCSQNSLHELGSWTVRQRDQLCSHYAEKWRTHSLLQGVNTRLHNSDPHNSKIFKQHMFTFLSLVSISFTPSFLRLGSWNIVMFVTYEQIKRGMTRTQYWESPFWPHLVGLLPQTGLHRQWGLAFSTTQWRPVVTHGWKRRSPSASAKQKEASNGFRGPKSHYRRGAGVNLRRHKSSCVVKTDGRNLAHRIPELTPWAWCKTRRIEVKRDTVNCKGERLH